MSGPQQSLDTSERRDPEQDTPASEPRAQEPAGGDPSVTPPPQEDPNELKREIERLKQSRAGWQQAYQQSLQRQPQPQQPSYQPAQQGQQPQWGADGLTADERKAKKKALEEMDMESYDQINQLATQRQTAMASLQTMAWIGAANQQQAQQKASTSFFDNKRVKTLNDFDHPITQRTWELYNERLYDPSFSQFQINPDQNGTFLGLLQLSMQEAERDLSKTSKSTPTGEEFIESASSGAARPGPKPKKAGPALLTDAERQTAKAYGISEQEYWDSMREEDRQSRMETGKPLRYR